MSEAMLARIIWFAVLGCAVSLAAHLFFGSTIAASAEGSLREVALKDRYQKGAHHISGMIIVPSACHDLSVRAHDVDPVTILIAFETWQQPYRDCAKESVPRAFSLVVYAPEEVKFLAVLDQERIPIQVIK